MLSTGYSIRLQSETEVRKPTCFNLNVLPPLGVQNRREPGAPDTWLAFTNNFIQHPEKAGVVRILHSFLNY